MLNMDYKWHYIIGVIMHSITSNTPGKIDLDFFFEIHIDDFKTSQMELIMKNSSDDPYNSPTPTADKINNALTAISLRHRFNATIMPCYFYANYQWTRELMKLHIQHTPLNKLKEARFTV